MDKLLQTHHGRDGLIKTACYAALFASGCTKGGLSRRLKSLSSEFSQCRVILRLLDDIPMLRYNITCNWGMNEKDPVIRILSVIKNVVDQLFYPIEHLAWFADKKLVKLKSSPLWTLGTCLWAISLYCGLARSIRFLLMIQKRRLRLQEGFPELFPEERRVLLREQLSESLQAIICAANLINAINALPDGVLWSGKLKRWHNGLVGVFASVLSLTHFILFK